MIGQGAAVDCERIGAGLLGQPVNTITCLSFLIGGALIWWLRRDGPSAVLVAGVGVGSIAFHGPMPPWGEFLHDVTIVWALSWVIMVETGRTHLWLAVFAAGTLLSIVPLAADPAQAILGVAAVFAVLRGSRNASPRRQGLRWLTVGALAIGGVIGRLSATGGPWCNPESLWQGHALWHIAAAAALTSWAVLLRPPDPTPAA